MVFRPAPFTTSASPRIGPARPLRLPLDQNFDSELWEEPGFGIKPEPSAAFEAPDDLDGWAVLAERVRAEQDALPAEKRIYIGGELYLLVIQNWQSQIVRLHRFDDYEQA